MFKKINIKSIFFQFIILIIIIFIYIQLNTIIHEIGHAIISHFMGGRGYIKLELDTSYDIMKGNMFIGTYNLENTISDKARLFVLFGGIGFEIIFGLIMVNIVSRFKEKKYLYIRDVFLIFIIMLMFGSIYSNILGTDVENSDGMQIRRILNQM